MLQNTVLESDRDASRQWGYVAVHQQLLIVHHVGIGTVQASAVLTKAVTMHMRALDSTKPYAVLHLSHALESADVGYAKAFARLFAEDQFRPAVHVATIDRPILRHLARLASSISGSRMQIVDQPQQILAFLQSARIETSWRP